MVSGIRFSRDLTPKIPKERVKTIIVEFLEKELKKDSDRGIPYSKLSELFVRASLDDSGGKHYSAFDDCESFCTKEELAKAKKSEVANKINDRIINSYYPNPISCKKETLDEALGELVSEGKVTLQKTGRARNSRDYSLSQKRGVTVSSGESQKTSVEPQKKWTSSVRIDSPEGSLIPKENGWEID